MLQTKVAEKIQTHFIFNNTFFPKNVPFMRKCEKIQQSGGRPQMTIRRMRIARWITKATNTHIQHVTRIAFPQLQLLQEGAFCYVTRTSSLHEKYHKL